MARFFGKVGYATADVEAAPGVHRETVVEREYFGDILINIRRQDPDEKVNNDISVSNRISLVADEFANGHFHEIRYVVWRGEYWTVPTVEVQSPRLILGLGEVYNGPRP